MDKPAVKTPKPTRNTLFYVLICLFAGPLILAFILFNTHQNWFKQHTINHGQLIVPPKRMNLSTMTTIYQKPISQNTFLGKWTLMMAIPSQCDDACQKELYVLQQIKKATGKHQRRIQNIALSRTPAKHPKLITLINKRFQDTTLLFTTPKALHALAGEHPANAKIYIIDPQGNMMMRYALSTKPKAILKDLQRLLKVSKMA